MLAAPGSSTQDLRFVSVPPFAGSGVVNVASQPRHRPGRKVDTRHQSGSFGFGGSLDSSYRRTPSRGQRARPQSASTVRSSRSSQRQHGPVSGRIGGRGENGPDRSAVEGGSGGGGSGSGAGPQGKISGGRQRPQSASAASFLQRKKLELRRELERVTLEAERIRVERTISRLQRRRSPESLRRGPGTTAGRSSRGGGLVSGGGGGGGGHDDDDDDDGGFGAAPTPQRQRQRPQSAAAAGTRRRSRAGGRPGAQPRDPRFEETTHGSTIGDDAFARQARRDQQRAGAASYNPVHVVPSMGRVTPSNMEGALDKTTTQRDYADPFARRGGVRDMMRLRKRQGSASSLAGNNNTSSVGQQQQQQQRPRSAAPRMSRQSPAHELDHRPRPEEEEDSVTQQQQQRRRRQRQQKQKQPPRVLLRGGELHYEVRRHQYEPPAEGGPSWAKYSVGAASSLTPYPQLPAAAAASSQGSRASRGASDGQGRASAASGTGATADDDDEKEMHRKKRVPICSGTEENVASLLGTTNWRRARKVGVVGLEAGATQVRTWKQGGDGGGGGNGGGSSSSPLSGGNRYQRSRSRHGIRSSSKRSQRRHEMMEEKGGGSPLAASVKQWREGLQSDHGRFNGQFTRFCNMAMESGTGDGFFTISSKNIQRRRQKGQRSMKGAGIPGRGEDPTADLLAGLPGGGGQAPPAAAKKRGGGSKAGRKPVVKSQGDDDNMIHHHLKGIEW